MEFRGRADGRRFRVRARVFVNNVVYKYRIRVSMDQNNQESRQKCSASRLSVRSFACTAHSFACYALPTSLARSTELTCSLARLLTHSRACGEVND